MSVQTKILITGATGMLGRSLLHNLSKTYECIGIGYSRASPPLKKIDLLSSPQEFTSLVQEFKPTIVIHAAAERRPDRAAEDPDRTTKLNVDVTRYLARECKRVDALMVYISTDYVFDGGVETKAYPPYGTDAPTGPVNDYGRSKLLGEEAVMYSSSNDHLRSLIVRIPVLYAYDCNDLEESASLINAKVLLGRKEITVDNWGIRFPTAVDDISTVLHKYIDSYHPRQQQQQLKKNCEIIHISSPEQCTKYQLVQLMGEILNVDTSHVKPDNDAPKGAIRPQNTQLDCSKTWTTISLDPRSDGGATPTPMEFVRLKDGMEKALLPFRSLFLSRG